MEKQYNWIWQEDTLKFIKPDGSVAKLYILVMTWPASYYTYATLIPDMTTASFCEGIVKGLQFFRLASLITSS